MRLAFHAVPALVAILAGCSSAPADPHGDAGLGGGTDAAGSADGAIVTTPGDADAATDAIGEASAASTDAGADGAGSNSCFTTSGVTGECMTVSACAALGNHTSTPGLCAGAATIECCTVTPSVADNPPTPAGYKLMQQAQVTPAMTAWAVAILHDPVTYPMFSTTTQTFGTQPVLARVEWHPPDFQNSVVHRGVTLYVPG